MNKYSKRYYSIIHNKKLNPSQEEYTETHHILPRSMGGKDTPENLVVLSGREHFICHYLLTKMYEVGSPKWYKSNHAFMFMSASKCGKRYVNSRLYDAARKRFSLVMSAAQSGTKNSQYGKVWIVHTQLLRNQKVYEHELEHWLSLGWTEGRIMNFHKPKIIPKRDLINQKYKQDAEHYWNLYITLNCKSMQQFVKDGHYPYSIVSLIKLWKKHIPDYTELVKHGKPFHYGMLYR